MKRLLTSAVASKAPWLTGALLLTALTSGCVSAPDRYYTLAAVAAPATATGVTPLYIELAPIALPERLARRQLLVRRQGAGASAQVEILEQHRWASSFENELRDALASGIASRLGAIDASKGGKPIGQAAWRIAVRVRQFDAVENSRVDADLDWTLKRSDRERGLTCQWTASESVGAAGIDALAQAAQRVTARAAHAMARDVAAMQGNPDAACVGSPA